MTKTADKKPLSEVERVKVDSLNLNPRNANAHTAESIETIRKGLETYGQYHPLVVEAKSRRVLIGNGRLRAMQALQWKECEIRWFRGTPAEAEKLALYDNRSSELSDWDTPNLAAILSELNDASFDLGSIGFTQAEFEKIVADADKLAAAAAKGEAEGFGAGMGPKKPEEFRVMVTFDSEPAREAFLQKAARQKWEVRKLD